MFRTAAARIFRLAPDEDDDGVAIKKVDKMMKKEMKERSPATNEYNIKLDSNAVEKCVSPTLQALSSQIMGNNYPSMP